MLTELRSYAPDATAPEVTAYTYDANGQILRTDHGDGSTEIFAYTPDLNLAGAGPDAERFTRWQTSQAGVVKLARGPQGEAITLEHDACGRVTRRTVARRGFRPQTWHFGWNAQDQLISAEGPDGRMWHYGYDPFGRRSFKACKGLRHDFLWDGDVIAMERRSDRAAPVEWFHEPDTFRPLARREGVTLFYIVTDHLGTPKEALTEGGHLVWSVDHSTWGSLRSHRRAVGDEDYWITASEGELPDHGVQPEAEFCPIRFQGQWEDAETGLYYNRFRYYEPGAGQYLSGDPIGLLGGTRDHAYVLAPSLFVDPDGLNPLRDVLVGAGCAVAGADWQAHHLIPQAVWRDFSGFFQSIGMGDQLHAARNGIALPTNVTDAIARNMCCHRGPHKSYNDIVEGKLDRIRNFVRDGRMTPSQARLAVEALQNDMRAHILSLPAGTRLC